MNKKIDDLLDSILFVSKWAALGSGVLALVVTIGKKVPATTTILIVVFLATGLTTAIIWLTLQIRESIQMEKQWRADMAELLTKSLPNPEDSQEVQRQKKRLRELTYLARALHQIRFF